jgi:hypothetical protein
MAVSHITVSSGKLRFGWAVVLTVTTSESTDEPHELVAVNEYTPVFETVYVVSLDPSCHV